MYNGLISEGSEGKNEGWTNGIGNQHLQQQLAIHSFIHSFTQAISTVLLQVHCYSEARILCRSFTLKCHRKLRVKDLPKVP